MKLQKFMAILMNKGSRYMFLVIKNQRGLSLIEVLATLVIFSIIMGLVTNAVISSLNYHDKSYQKLLLTQKANTFLSGLASIHQTSDSYTLKYDPYGTFLIKTDQDATFYQLGDENFLYRVEIAEKDKSFFYENGKETTLTVQTSDSVKVKVTISNNTGENELTVETILARLSGGIE
jgi:prepilin-type N-terminal cleavage/methylation domain-containing protein